MGDNDTKVWIAALAFVGFLLWQPTVVRNKIIRCVERAETLERAEHCAREA